MRRRKTDSRPVDSWTSGAALRHSAVVAFRVAILLSLLAGAVAVQAQDATPPQPSSADELGGLLEGLDLQVDPEPLAPATDAAAMEQGTPAELVPPDGSPAGSPLVEAYRSMQAANALLAQGQADQATLAAQQRAVDLLDQLIQAAQQQSERAQQSKSTQTGQASEGERPMGEAGQGAAGEGQREQAEANGSGADEAGGDDRQGAQPGNAQGGTGEPGGQSSAAVAAAGGGIRPAAGAGGEAVWGHLPERTRGMLRAEVPTEYLPPYADEISEYFRILAEMNPDE